MEIKNRRYDRDIRLDSGKRIILDEETIFFEIQSLFDYSEMITGDSKLDIDYKRYSKELKSIMSDDDFLVKLAFLSRFMTRMEIIRKLKNDKISMSELTDKYGNKYLKAKTSFPEYTFKDGKKKVVHKSISVHLGKSEDFKGGIESEEVKVLAYEKLLRKVTERMNVKFENK
jgi:hypothetical protein